MKFLNYAPLPSVPTCTYISVYVYVCMLVTLIRLKQENRHVLLCRCAFHGNNIFLVDKGNVHTLTLVLDFTTFAGLTAVWVSSRCCSICIPLGRCIIVKSNTGTLLVTYLHCIALYCCRETI